MHGSESMAVESNLADQGVLRVSCLSKHNHAPAGMMESILCVNGFERLDSMENEEHDDRLLDC